MRKKERFPAWLPLLGILLFLILFFPPTAAAQPFALPRISLEVAEAQEPGEVVLALQILLLLTVLSLVPALMIMVTSFTRIIIVLSFVRSGLATQNMPPNQVLIALALFLTFFTMVPYWAQINEEALQPYLQGNITFSQAVETAQAPVRTFMFRQTREKDLALFVSFTGQNRPQGPADIPTYVLIPAFVISELRTAFQMGFLIYIPFLVIDMVVASTLMSMGMLMLPPVMISLPFKVLLFVLVDGWHLVVRSLVLSFA